MSPELSKELEIKREVGVVEHKDLKIDSINQAMMKNKIIHSQNLRQVTDYVANSRSIITNSYHVAYWGTLMSKKVVVIDKFSSKFDYYKYKPEFLKGNLNGQIPDSTIYATLEKAKIYNGALYMRPGRSTAIFSKELDQ